MADTPHQIKPSWAALPLELIVGVVFFAHGLSKLADVHAFASNVIIPMGLPSYVAYLVTAAEFGGAILLLSGVLVRLGAFGHLCVMAVAVLQVHWKNGLVGPGSFEFPLALLGASLALLILGPDPLSIQRNAGDYFKRPEAVGGPSRREFLDITLIGVKAAGVLLILAGIAVVAARQHLAIPEGTAPVIIVVVAGMASFLSGGALIFGKVWAYIPAFVLARLYLAGGVLLLFWVKYAVRGASAVAIGFLMLALLRRARRGSS